MEDVRIGRKAFFRRVTTTIGAGESAQLFPFAPDRIALILPNLGPTSSIVVDTLTISAVTGLFSLANEGLELTITKHGQLVTSAWHGFNPGAGPATVTGYETVLQVE